MSLYDYKASYRLGTHPFYALIMAAMRQADSDNADRLRIAWPLVWDEFKARYHALDGVLPGEEVK